MYMKCLCVRFHTESSNAPLGCLYKPITDTKCTLQRSAATLKLRTVQEHGVHTGKNCTCMCVCWSHRPRAKQQCTITGIIGTLYTLHPPCLDWLAGSTTSADLCIFPWPLRCSRRWLLELHMYGVVLPERHYVASTSQINSVGHYDIFYPKINAACCWLDCVQCHFTASHLTHKEKY